MYTVFVTYKRSEPTIVGYKNAEDAVKQANVLCAMTKEGFAFDIEEVEKLTSIWGICHRRKDGEATIAIGYVDTELL